jgi:hypothetical protein
MAATAWLFLYLFNKLRRWNDLKKRFMAQLPPPPPNLSSIPYLHTFGCERCVHFYSGGQERKEEPKMGVKEDKMFLGVLQEFFPVRAQLLGNFISEASKSGGPLDKWRAEQLFRFIGLLTQNVEDLVTGYEQKRITKVAWAARNILELSIWVDYCNLSDTHAKRFRDDSARDLLGFAKAIQTIVTKLHGKPDARLAQKQQEMVTFGQAIYGISGLKDDFTRVSEAARKVGKETEFLSLNKIYSKFAHPTSIALNSIVAVDADAGFRGMFFVDAVKHSTATLTTIREVIVKHYPHLENVPFLSKTKRAGIR